MLCILAYNANFNVFRDEHFYSKGIMNYCIAATVHK